ASDRVRGKKGGAGENRGGGARIAWWVHCRGTGGRSMRMATAVLIGLVIGSGLVSCGTPTRDRAREPVARPRPGETYVVARSEGRPWTGGAVTRRGRGFVSYPRWEGPIDNSVEEVLPDGTRVAFPDEEWNSWRPGDDPASKFVCVQAVYVD